MSRKTTNIIKAALSALHYSGTDSIAAPFAAGRGVIFMLHHVRPGSPREFEPNRILAVTPQFLDQVIAQVVATGYDPISLDDVPARLADPAPKRPFACFTLDDGYRDNRDHALPIFRKHQVPCTIYVPSAFADGEGEVWWLTLEEAIRRFNEFAIEMDGRLRRFETRTPADKASAFHAVYWWLRTLPEREGRAIVHRLGASAGIASTAFCKELVMNWDELRALAADPLVTIGAHTKNHYAVAKLSGDEARSEIAGGVERIEAELQRPCRHFSFPYGDETSAAERDFKIAGELGLTTAVTTRKGLLHASHASKLTALPRLSLNGDYQEALYLKVLLSGVPFALRDALQKFMHRDAA